MPSARTAAPPCSAASSFRSRLLPTSFFAPQLLVTLVFFSGRPARRCISRRAAKTRSACTRNSSASITSSPSCPTRPTSTRCRSTTVFSVSVTVLALVPVAPARGHGRFGLVRGARVYKTCCCCLMPWHPDRGVRGCSSSPPASASPPMACAGWAQLEFRLARRAGDAAGHRPAAWKQISYHFLFFLARLQSIPNR